MKKQKADGHIDVLNSKEVKEFIHWPRLGTLFYIIETNSDLNLLTKELLFLKEALFILHSRVKTNTNKLLV